MNKSADVDLNKRKRKMNSTISDDLTREHLTLEAVKCLSRLCFKYRNSSCFICFLCDNKLCLLIAENISSNSQSVTLLHKELLEINLSITAYIEESKKRLAGLRLDLANEAKSSQRVVEILSDKCEYTCLF